ncbi:hypothetical protein FB565_006172 [Actinoplanes lutulentus]|nr:hypothetical protein [Actinoplanes lutulentus]
MVAGAGGQRRRQQGDYSQAKDRACRPGPFHDVEPTKFGETAHTEPGTFPRFGARCHDRGPAGGTGRHRRSELPDDAAFYFSSWEAAQRRSSRRTAASPRPAGAQIDRSTPIRGFVVPRVRQRRSQFRARRVLDPAESAWSGNQYLPRRRPCRPVDRSSGSVGAGSEMYREDLQCEVAEVKHHIQAVGIFLHVGEDTSRDPRHRRPDVGPGRPHVPRSAESRAQPPLPYGFNASATATRRPNPR